MPGREVIRSDAWPNAVVHCRVMQGEWEDDEDEDEDEDGEEGEGEGEE